MRLFAALFLLQQLISAHGFLRLGTVSVSGTSGTVYLIDSNSIFLFEFTASEALIIQGNSGVNGTTSGAVSSVSMVVNANGNLLTTPTIEIRTVASNNLLVNFQVPNNVYIPCNAEYLGRFGRPSGNTLHALDGHVFLDRSARRFFVAGLDVDGSAPAAYFWLGTSTTPSASGKIAGNNGAYSRVINVYNVDVNVTIPPEYTDTVFQSLSVWCEAFTVSFGHVNIPVVAADSFSCSTTFGPVSLGFTPPRHQVSAEVYVLGPTTIGFKNVNFDGTAPATWYWSGTTSTFSNGFIVPDQTGSLTKLGSLTNANVVITLPAEYDVCNTEFISLYCVQASANFGDVRFSSDFGCSNCPTRCKTNTDTPVLGFQCKDLSTTSKFRLEYLYDSANSLVTFKFRSCDIEANSYVAFGLSASNTGTSMAPNADVVVCQYTTIGQVNCTDYDLTIRSQCAISSGTYNGACPDHVLSGGVNNYINTQFEQQNGVTTYTTSRNIDTGDSHDRLFTPGTSQYVIWAKGGTFSSPINERWVLRHAPSNRATTQNPIQIDFATASSCAEAFECPTTTAAPVTPWEIPPLCVNSDNNDIFAAIGNTGGRQGYKGITGVDGWGIAWFLNGTLIPEVYVLRGTTVKFYVNGGDDASDSAAYHPFYLTSSEEGGIFSLFQANQPITETVYAGIDHNTATGAVANLTVGPYCEWVETQGIGDNFDTFEEYKATLTYTCSASGGAGQFEWTTDANTPDLVYYQCATHRLLGWKIHVVDSLASCWQSLGIATTNPTTVTTNPTPVTNNVTTPATTTAPPSFQCSDLSISNNVRVHYLYSSGNNTVTFKIQTCSLEANHYIAFGLSASNSGVSMVPNADVVVCYYTNEETAVCTDYNLASRSSCFSSGGTFDGACPDVQFASGVNNYVDTSFENRDGVTTFTTTRPVTSSDSEDTNFTPGTPQYVIWAKGTTFQGSGSIRWVNRHSSSNRASTGTPVQIDIGASSTCGLPLTCPTQAPTTSSAIVPTPVATPEPTSQPTTNTPSVTSPTPSFQCSDLSISNNVRVHYLYSSGNNAVTFKIQTCSLEANHYIAFGLSASNFGVSMVPNADVVVCYYTNEETAVCTDYNLASRSSCFSSGGTFDGACPDVQFASGVNNYVDTSFENRDGVTTFTTTRPVTSSDSEDTNFTPGTPQYVIWAKGMTFQGSGSIRWVSQHSSSNRASFVTPVQMDISATSTCNSPLTCPTQAPVTTTMTQAPVTTTMTQPTQIVPWTVAPVCINSDSIVSVTIGNSQSKVNGGNSLLDEVAWYIDGKLRPEIYVIRNTQITFTVNGGNDPTDTANFHPFYLTNSSKGGIIQLLNENKPVNETVYAGLEIQGNMAVDLTVGSLCKYAQTVQGENFNSFEEYQETLDFICYGDIVEGQLIWKPDDITPETLYYQCAQHELHGGKIHVVEDIAPCFQLQLGAGCIHVPLSLLIILAIVLTAFYSI